MGHKISSVLVILATVLIRTCFSLNATLQWEITVKQKEKEINKVIVALGIYSPIEIIFTKIGEEPIPNINGVLKLSSKEFQTPEEDAGIPFDTSKSTSIQTHIGRSCSLPTEDKHSIVIQFKPESASADSIKISDVTITISILLFELTITQKDQRIFFQGSSTYSITPSSDQLMNVDDILITFTGENTNSADSYADNYEIKKYPNKGDQFKEFGLKAKFDFIVYSQKFTPLILIKPEIQKCFMITNSIEFSLKEKDIVLINQQVKKDLMDNTITDEKDDYSFDLLIKGFKIYPIEINCAMYCKEIGEITDQDIITNDHGEYSTQVLNFARAIHETKEPLDLALTFKSMSRLCLHRMKCIVTPHNIIEEPQNFQYESMTIGSSSIADIHREIKLSLVKFSSINCGVWRFVKNFNKKEFESKAIEYLKANIPLSPDEKDKSCLAFELNKYMAPLKTLTTICIIPNEACLFRDSYHYYSSFNSVMKDLSSTPVIITKLKLEDKELDLAYSHHESDYEPYNYKDIVASISAMEALYFTIEVYTKGNPGVCTFKAINDIEEYDFYEEDFYDSPYRFEISSAVKYINVDYTLKETNNTMITIYINCLNFLEHAHYHHYAPYKILNYYITDNALPIPSKEKLADCTELDPFKPHCKEYIVIDYPSYGKNPIQKFPEYTQFTSLDINSKIDYINNQKIDMKTLSKDDLISLSLLGHQLSLVNCMKYNSFTKCRMIKNRLITDIVNKIKLYTFDYLKKENEYFKLEYTNTLFFISQNKDTLMINSGKTFVDIVIQYFMDIETIIKEFKSETNASLFSICNGILNNMIDILQYEEIDKGIESQIDLHTRIIVNDYAIKVKEAIERILPLTKNYSLINQYHNFVYSFLNTTEKGTSEEQMKEFILEDKDSSKINIPLYYFNKNQIDYLLVIVYDSYPLLSCKNSQTNEKVIAIKAYSKDNHLIEVIDLPKTVSINYGNIKVKDEMKYCGYFNNKNKTISTVGIISQTNNDDKPICETNHFSDFIITKYQLDSNLLSIPIWVIIVSSIVAVLLIVIISYFLYLRYKPSKLEEDISKTNPILCTNEVDH